jgi:hypothetical protein
MLKRGLAALCASVVMACAGHAAAAVMIATLSGSFDPIRLSPTHQFVTGGWTATLTYDTSLGVFSNSGGEQRLDWSSASGGPSPLTSALLTAFGNDGTNYSYALDDFTSFSVVRSINGTSLDFSTLDIGFAGTNFSFQHDFDLGANFALDAPYFYSTFQSGLNPISSNIRSADFNGSAYTDLISIAQAPIPEPSVWSMMILGFLGMGVMIRRQRTYLAAQ